MTRREAITASIAVTAAFLLVIGAGLYGLLQVATESTRAAVKAPNRIIHLLPVPAEQTTTIAKEDRHD